MGRAKNAVLSFLEGKLSVPRIYLATSWAGHPVDVLAIDRDGVGDVHAVLLFGRKYPSGQSSDAPTDLDQLEQSIQSLNHLPAQYKYVAAVDLESDRHWSPFKLSETTLDGLFAPDGLGRIGILKVDVPSNGDPEVRTEVKPERFRAKIAELADAYVQEHTADWEIRA